MLRNATLLILVNAIALYITTQVLPADFMVTGGWAGFVTAGLIFGILNSIVKPILKVLTLPFVFLTGGLFIFIINAAILWLAKLVLEILGIQNIAIVIKGGFMTWLYAILIIGVTNVVMNWLVKKD